MLDDAAAAAVVLRATVKKKAAVTLWYTTGPAVMVRRRPLKRRWLRFGRNRRLTRYRRMPYDAKVRILTRRRRIRQY
jgi:hypothetical protein